MSLSLRTKTFFAWILAFTIGWSGSIHDFF